MVFYDHSKMCAESTEMNNNRRVLFIFDSKFSEWKGTQKFFYEFGNYLKKNGYEITLIENNRNSEINLLPKGLELPFNIVSCRFRKMFSIFSVPRKIIDDINPAIIYANSFNTLPTLPRYNYRTIYGMHIIHVSSLKYMKIGRIKFRIKTYLFKILVYLFWTDKEIMIHALNDDQANWIKTTLKNRFPVRVIGNPVDCTIEDDIVYLRNMKKNEKFTLLFFGALSKEKGFANFLKILDYAEESHINKKISVIIAGAGKLRKDAINRVEKYENVMFIEKPDDKTKKELMLASDLFIFPSISENFCFTAVEAQSSGLPCLLSDITPFKNIVITDKTGYCLSLSNHFEKQFFSKINDYLNLWQTDYNKFIELRMDIAKLSRRLCKENVLPHLLDIVVSLIKDRKESAT